MELASELRTRLSYYEAFLYELPQRHRHSHTCYRIITPRLLHFLSLLLLGSSVQPEHCGLDRNADKLSSGTRWMNCYESWKYFWPLTVINKSVEGKEEDMLFLNLMCISSSSCCCRSFFYSVLFISYNKGQQVRSVNNAVGCEHWNWIPIKRRLLFSLVYNCMVWSMKVYPQPHAYSLTVFVSEYAWRP